MPGISDVVRQIHSSRQRAREWQAIVDAIAALVPGCGVMLISRSNAADERLHLLHAGYPAGAMEFATERFASRLGASNADTGSWRGGAPISAAVEIASDEHAVSPPLIREWGARFGLSACYRALVWDDARRTLILRIDHRKGMDDAATAAVQNVLSELAGHLRIAFATAARLLRMSCANTLALFDRLAIPSLALDWRGSLVGMGDLARVRLMAAGVILVHGAGGVRLANARENEEFRALLAASGTGGSRRYMMPFSVPNQPGPNILECVQANSSQAAASAAAEWAGTSEPYTLVQFRCRGALALPTVADVCVLGLSKTEAMTAIGLVEGLTAEEQATARKVAAETARWHAKNIYERLDCDRAEMTRLLLGLLEPRQGLPDGAQRAPVLSGVDGIS